MRISYLSGSYFPSRQANSIHVVQMAAAMRAVGHDVVLYGRRVDGESCDPDHLCDYYGVPRGLNIECLPKRASPYGRELQYAYQLRGILRATTPDLIFSRHYFASAFCAGLAPFIYEAHAMPLGFSTQLTRFLLRQRNLRAVIVISEALARDYQSAFSLDAPLVVEPDAVTPKNYEAIKPVDLERKSALRIGYCGHLYEGRGIELILKIAEERPHFDFHIIGGEPRDIQRYTSGPNRSDNVVFHGFVAPGEIPRYLAAMDVLIAPYQRRIEVYGGQDTSRWFSPMKLFEYMDAGKAIVISDHAVLHEVLEHGSTALMVDPEDATQWCRALDQLADDTSFRDSLGERARNLVRERYTWQGRAERIVRMFAETGESGI